MAIDDEVDEVSMEMTLEGLADELMRAFGAPTIITNTEMRMLAYSEHPEPLVDEFRRRALVTREDFRRDADQLVAEAVRSRRPVRTPIDDEPRNGRVFDRVVVPLMVESTLYGFALLIDRDRRVDLTDLDDWKGVFLEGALIIAALENAEHAGSALLRGLLDDDPDQRAQAANALHISVGLASDHSFRVIAIRLTHHASLGRLPFLITRTFGNGVRTASIDSDTIAVLCGEGSGDLAARAHELVRTCKGLDAAISVAIGPAVANLKSAVDSCRLALRALALPRATGADVVSWDALGAWRVLLSVDVETRWLSSPRITRFLAESDASDRHLVETYLQENGNVRAASERVHLHRATLCYRIARIRKQYGIDLTDRETQLELTLVLRLHALETERSRPRG